MLTFLFRSLGFLLLTAAFAALIVDATRSIAGERILWFSLGDTAGWLMPAWLAALRQAAVARGLVTPLSGLLDLPTALVCGVLGGLAMALGRGARRRPRPF